MSSLNYSLTISIFLIASSLAFTSPSQAQKEEQIQWAKRSETGKEVITTLQFYFHDIVSGKNATATRIAQSPQTNNSNTLFGALMMIDDPLTVGPEPDSKIVGRARGMYGSAGLTDFGLIMVLNYGFVDGIYDGSSFSLLSINPAVNPVREMAIVGGTGLFRMARGFAIARTHWLDAATGDAVVGYNVTIATYV